MSRQPRILAFAGSTRRDSFNKKLVAIAARGARAAGAEVTEVDLRDFPMPLYDGDLEAERGLPEQAVALKKLFIAHDGLLISSPEYNGSFSAVFKNTIDWLSRPAPGEASLLAYQGKTAAILSASPGPLGGMRSLIQVRMVLGALNVLVLPDQLAVGRAGEAFQADGSLKDAQQQARVEQIAAKLVQTIAKLQA